MNNSVIFFLNADYICMYMVSDLHLLLTELKLFILLLEL